MTAADIVNGFQNQIWRIRKMDSLDQIWEELVPFSEADEAAIRARLEELAKTELTAREIEETPSLYKATDQTGGGKRLIISAGDNPYYVASLWRSDEMPRTE